MSEIELYSGNFIGKEEEIFKSLKNVKFGDLLPKDGAFAFFYEQVLHPATSLFLKSKKRVKFFYVDHDDFFPMVMGQDPEWVLDVDENLLKINLLFQAGEDPVPVIFVFDIARGDYRDAIRLINKSGKFELYFISILYGGLVVENKVEFKIPKSILKTFKSIK